MTPTTTMRPRSTVGGRRRPTRAPIRPPMVAPARDEADGRPVHVGDDDEEDGRDAVDHGGEHVLEAVEALQRGRSGAGPSGEQVYDALGGAEVAAVDAGEEACRAAGRVRRRTGTADALAVTAGLDGAGEPRLKDDQDEGERDERGHNGVERLGRQGDQEDGSADAAEQADRTEAQQPLALTSEFAAVADGARDGARARGRGRWRRSR